MKIVGTFAVLCSISLLLCFHAFYNNYPLVYPDTGSYIFSGFESFIPRDRPMTYGLIIRHLSLKESTWLVVYFQAFLTTVAMYILFTRFIKDHLVRKILFAISVLILVLMTGISCHVSQLIPDIFAGLMSLSFVVLLTHSGKIDFCYWVLLILLWLSLIVHNSHLMIGVGGLFLTAILMFLKQLTIPFSRLIGPTLVLLVSFITIPMIHLTLGKSFEFSKDSPNFVLNKLIEIGVVDKFLTENCDENEYPLCYTNCTIK